MSDNNGNKRKAVYTVVESDSDSRKARWVRLGIAFVNRDGSLTVLLDGLPVSGKLHIRDFPASEESGAGSAERSEAAGAAPASTPTKLHRTTASAA